MLSGAGQCLSTACQEANMAAEKPLLVRMMSCAAPHADGGSIAPLWPLQVAHIRAVQLLTSPSRQLPARHALLQDLPLPLRDVCSAQLACRATEPLQFKQEAWRRGSQTSPAAADFQACWECQLPQSRQCSIPHEQCPQVEAITVTPASPHSN